ncbi:hypothetical protein K439DRAFT_1624223 [Ramaria rubella]|nr:hypothetical protein K439DRAFT_1624223 [Ramaria rubella]
MCYPKVNLFVWLTFVLIPTLAQGGPDSDFLTIQTQQGVVTGALVTPDVRQFLGIPFATANRWSALQLPPVKNTMLDAVSFGDSCVQQLSPIALEDMKLLHRSCNPSAGSGLALAFTFTHPDDIIVKGMSLAPMVFRELLNPTGWNVVATAIGCGPDATSAQLTCIQAVPFTMLKSAVVNTSSTFVLVQDDVCQLRDIPMRKVFC